MENKICKKVLIYAAGVAVGLSFMILIVSFALLILGAAEIYDNNLTKYTAIALACFIVSVLASCAFAGFSSRRLFKITSAALCLVLAVLCIVFLALVRIKTGMAYTDDLVYFVFLCVIASASAVLAFFYMLNAVFDYKRLDVKEVGGGE